MTAQASLDIKGCKNFRDLGGLQGKNGLTRYGKLYRTDCMSRLTNEDIEQLKTEEGTCVIDLRTSPELGRSPNPTENAEGFIYYNISLFDGIKSKDYINNSPESLPGMYRDLIDEAGEYIARVYKTMLKHENNRTIFHCSAGKDRTGIIAALLLRLAGVDDETIINNYSVSYTLMEDVFKAQAAQLRRDGINVNEALYLTEPEYMRELLLYIDTNYSGVRSYLLRFLTEEEIKSLEDMLSSR